jgi:hypothetical protein
MVVLQKPMVIEAKRGLDISTSTTAHIGYIDDSFGLYNCAEPTLPPEPTSPPGPFEGATVFFFCWQFTKPLSSGQFLDLGLPATCGQVISQVASFDFTGNDARLFLTINCFNETSEDAYKHVHFILHSSVESMPTTFSLLFCKVARIWRLRNIGWKFWIEYWPC